MEKGTVTTARLLLNGERLRVMIEVRTVSGEVREVSLPDREVAAILPRSILLGGSCRAPLSLLGTLQPIMARMSEGRMVRMWQYGDRWFCSFLPWKSVRFVPEDDDPPAAGPPVDGPAVDGSAAGSLAVEGSPATAAQDG
jgi:hypothetical protein